MLEPHLGENVSVFHGDCLDIMGQLPMESIDLIFADPPYNIGKTFGSFQDNWSSDSVYVEWCCAWLTACIRLLAPKGTMYFMSSTQAMPYLDVWIRERLNIISRIIWHYDSSGVQAKSRYGSLYEPILHCTKDPKSYVFNSNAIAVEARTGAVRKLIDYRKPEPAPYSTTKVPGNTWYFPRVRYRMPEYESHPSQKPEALLERVILASSNEGDSVLDPFSGTFTTSAVAQRLNRKAIGIELEEDYVEIGIRRLGIATHFNGKELKPLEKYHARRKQGISESVGDDLIPEQPELFDAQI